MLDEAMEEMLSGLLKIRINFHLFLSHTNAAVPLSHETKMPSALGEGGEDAFPFFMLVMLTVFIATLGPVLGARLCQSQKRSRGTFGACCVLVAACLLWGRVQPSAAAWANASAAFDPHATLGVAPDADVLTVKRAYRAASREHHPDKGGDPVKFMALTLAHAALAGSETERANYEVHGHPDGPRRFVAGIAMPRAPAQLLALYLGLGALLVVALLLAAKESRTGRGRKWRPPRKTVVALRGALSSESRPQTPASQLTGSIEDSIRLVFESGLRLVFGRVTMESVLKSHVTCASRRTSRSDA